MDPKIINLIEDHGTLKFTLNGVNVSVANALRRITLSNIPTFVFKTQPHEENKSTFHINTTRMNNELIKQRLSCIPIHLNMHDDIPYQDYELIIDMKNETNNVIYITTEDFKIKNKQNKKMLTKDEIRNIFPPDPLTRQFIDFIRLRPKLSDEIN